MTDHVLHRWLSHNKGTVGKHNLLLLSEADGGRPACLDDLRAAVRAHYVSAQTGKAAGSSRCSQAAHLLREHLPLGKRARSGDFGEILATEVAEQHLEYEVPFGASVGKTAERWHYVETTSSASCAAATVGSDF